MSKPNWTPGTWAVGVENSDVGSGSWFTTETEEARVATEIFNEADAHLIAAAPDLYAELENARVIIWGEAPQYGAALARIHSALAKARGER